VQWPAAITNLRELPAARNWECPDPDTPTLVTQLHVYPEVITTLPPTLQQFNPSTCTLCKLQSCRRITIWRI